MHLERFLKGAQVAKIAAPSKDELEYIILHTIAAGQLETAFVRYWLTAGRGNFSVSSKNCSAPGFFCVVHPDAHQSPAPPVKAVIVDVPLKTQLLATMKTNNYMINALVQLEAEAAGADMGIQVDSAGFITESSVSTVGIITADRKNFIIPPFDNILTSTTCQRVQAILPRALPQMKFIQRAISVPELFKAAEVIDFGGHFCRPVSEINKNGIGNGLAGPGYLAISDALLKDMLSNEAMLHDPPFAL
jgi:4-amino-4-deoxychorismate lyase